MYMGLYECIWVYMNACMFRSMIKIKEYLLFGDM